MSFRTQPPFPLKQDCRQIGPGMRPKLPFKTPRSRAKEGPAFVFVDTTDNLSIGIQDQEVRVIIRRQAARSGSKHRREASTNQGSNDAPEMPGVLARPSRTSVISSDPQIMPPNVLLSAPAPVPSYNGYETLRVKYNFDITDLASLTDVDLGRFAYLSLRDQPTRLISLLQKQSSSFLLYLPSRYGSNQCLDDAIHCVAARAGQMLGFPLNASTLATLYVKALNSLQTAIEDKALFLGAEVYCATRLLAIYELIGLPDANHWIHHNRGGIKMVELRGPEHHKSEFDRMLLRSQGPSILVDEMYRKQTSIFEASGWQRFLEYASKTETDTDSSLWWEFFGTISYIPGILKDMRILLESSVPQSHYLWQSSDILKRANTMYTALHESHIRYQCNPPYLPSLFYLPVSAESPVRVRLRGFLLYVIMYISRVKATLSLSAIERATSEVEAQAFAAQALLTEKMTANLDPTMTWHLEQRNTLAQSIIQSRNVWASDGQHGISPEDQRSFLAQRWLKWEDLWRDGVLTVELGKY